jgi:hypothetical protein
MGLEEISDLMKSMKVKLINESIKKGNLTFILGLSINTHIGSLMVNAMTKHRTKNKDLTSLSNL